jgi:hypothetical protein
MNILFRIRSCFVATVATCFLAPLAAVAATDNGTLSAGSYPFGPSCILIPQIAIGYYASLFGSYSPTNLTGGGSVFGVYDVTSFGCFSDFSVLIVNGFTSNPGKNWLTSITCNGVTNATGSAAFTYDSGNGVAYWNWSQFFGFSSASSASCSITHN